ncbi:G-type lectin S-receptor-like serine/threonine-protein kinase LECRK2 [Quercus robur]|uniref:G-type lectin S-receptor-like serine/threonine-protein kinase LECRK2 n=1 Tax=Quercus robur TaxID=38942 RepID=UPI002161D6F0|nr:G-type lectin S-receptor-like serine/threonine-protein kinase LECRK2 [Quercus robur]
MDIAYDPDYDAPYHLIGHNVFGRRSYLSLMVEWTAALMVGRLLSKSEMIMITLIWVWVLLSLQLRTVHGYTRIPDKTIVWYANGDTPAPSGSQVKLTADNGLVLTSPLGQQLWSSQTITGNVAFGVMNDAGNFELKDSNSNMVWQSLSNPTDTILPTQSLERGGVLSSRQSETNFSKGRFQVRFLDDGNLVFNTINLPSTYANDPPYYESGTIGDNNNSSPGIQLALSESGSMYIVRENKQRFVLGKGVVNSQTDYYYRATLDFDGVFTLYSHPKISNGSWTVVWSEPENICMDIFLKQGTGACGFNSICTLKDSRPTCKCPPGYSLMDPNDQYSSCKPDFIQGCEEDKLSSSEDQYSLEERDCFQPTCLLVVDLQLNDACYSDL